MEYKYFDFKAVPIIVNISDTLRWERSAKELHLEPDDICFQIEAGATVVVTEFLKDDHFKFRSLDSTRYGYGRKYQFDNFDELYSQACNFLSAEASVDELPPIETIRSETTDAMIDDLNESMKSFQVSDQAAHSTPMVNRTSKVGGDSFRPTSAHPTLPTIFEKKRHMPDSTLLSEEEVRLDEVDNPTVTAFDAAAFNATMDAIKDAVSSLEGTVSKLRHESEHRFQMIETRFEIQEASIREIKNLYRGIRRESIIPQPSEPIIPEPDTDHNTQSKDGWGLPTYSGLPALDRTGLPPSSQANKTANNTTSWSSSLDKTLAYIRKNQDKVPQWEEYKSKFPMVLFFGKIIYRFARTHQLLNPSLLDQWVPFAFPEVNQERIYLYLHQVQRDRKGQGLFTIFRELAKKLKPDEVITIDSLRSRQPLETLEDLIIRLNSEIPMCQQMSEDEVPNHVYNFILRTENNTPLGIEFKRAALTCDKSSLSVDSLLDVARRIDRIISTESSSGPSRQRDSYVNALKRHSPKQYVNKPTTTFSQQTNKPMTTFSQCSFALCITCNSKHERKRPDGGFWPYCQECFVQRTQRTYQKDPIYNKPPRTNTTRPCRTCKKQHSDRNLAGHLFPHCTPCFQASRRASSPRNTYPLSANNRSERIHISEVDDDPLKRTAEVLQVNQIYKLKTRSHYDPKRYRMHVMVSGERSSSRFNGLIDTGANMEVLSLAACTRLGIAHKIRKCHQSTIGVDGFSIGVIGVVHTTIFVGDVPYTANFQVLKHIENFDIMIGTRFLLQSELMEKIYSVVGKGVGIQHLSKGN